MDIKNIDPKVVGNHTQAMKHMGKLSLKIEIITEYVEKQILEYKKANIHSSSPSPVVMSYNVGAVDALTKVLEMLRKQP